jgi:hypothetical protein
MKKLIGQVRYYNACLKLLHLLKPTWPVGATATYRCCASSGESNWANHVAQDLRYWLTAYELKCWPARLIFHAQFRLAHLPEHNESRQQ